MRNLAAQLQALQSVVTATWKKFWNQQTKQVC